ncbi:MAG: hypothetical protein IPL08_14220 [Saprospiraceae bacterium]|nr:hypothetical protein [Saprospiraceae bacterium]
MQGGTEAVWNEFLSTKVNTSTPHLAIGKEINLDGTFKKFWVSLNIPNQGMLDCYTESDKNNILSILASLNSGNSQSYPTPKSILEKTKSLVSIIICRCGEENGNRSGCTTPTLNSIEDELTLLGYANYNHLESISFQPKDYIGGLTSSYKILLKINSSVASAESFPNGTFELTEELNDFLGEAGGNAVVYYIDKNNIHLFKDILNGGPSF